MTGGRGESGDACSPGFRLPSTPLMPSDPEPRARDILGELAARRVLGASVVERAGRRGWAPPRFAKGGRIFARCGLPDPWDPSAPDVKIELGEVGLAARRAPAPHAAPPGAPKAAAPGPAGAPPAAGDKLAHLPPHIRAMIASGGGSGGGKPAPKIGERRADDTDTLRAKSAGESRVRPTPTPPAPSRVNQPVAKLPVRPDLAQATEGRAAKAPGKGPSPPPVEPGPPRRGALPPGSGSPGRPPPGAVVRPAGPALEPVAPIAPAPRGGAAPLSGAEVAGGPPVRPAPGAAVPPAPVARAAPVEVARAAPAEVAPPAAAPVAPPTPAVTPPSVAPAAPAPVDRSPSGGRAAGLDDLFGMGAPGENTRLKLGAPTEGRTRRPKVTDTSQLSAGVDRRPPTFASPAVTPAGTPPKPPEGHGGG